MCELIPLQVGRDTGIVDMTGTPLAEGDHVLSYNIMAPGETYPLKAPKRGVLCEVRREYVATFKETWIVAMQIEGDHHGAVRICGDGPASSSDPVYGVRKVAMQ